jgi:hypothetical protein
VLVEGTLERHASAGGAINVLVQRLTPLDASDLRTERPAATVKDFSPLDERERQRILEEQPLVAVAGGGAGAGAAGAGPPPGRSGALAAVAASGSLSNGAAGSGPGGGGQGDIGRGAGLGGAPTGSGCAPPAAGRRSGGTNPTGGLTALRRETRSDGGEPQDPTDSGDDDGRPPGRPVREHGGAEDFRAVAPPVMSFTQGRRR